MEKLGRRAFLVTAGAAVALPAKSFPALATLVVEVRVNTAWALADLLLRSGFTVHDLDVPSFEAAAALCDQPVPPSIRMQVMISGNGGKYASLRTELPFIG